MNLARAVGPAVGGFLVAAVGAGWVFALNAVSFVAIAVMVASWRAPVRTDTAPRERLVEALWAGGRYVRHALIVRRLLYRSVLFIPAASAVWALLPVVAARNLHLGSTGYGLLLGMVGIGAVAGALVIPRLRARVGSARLVTGAMVLTGIDRGSHFGDHLAAARRCGLDSRCAGRAAQSPPTWTAGRRRTGPLLN
jgi:predicted MFS family arabinose efflux permease